MKTMISNQISPSNRRISRRDFLRIIAIGTAGGLALKYGLTQLPADEIVSETRILMGTIINTPARRRNRY